MIVVPPVEVSREKPGPRARSNPIDATTEHDATSDASAAVGADRHRPRIAVDGSGGDDGVCGGHRGEASSTTMAVMN